MFYRVSNGGTINLNSSVKLNSSVTNNFTVTDALKYSLLIVVGCASTGGSISGISITCSDPNPIYFNNSIAYGTGGGITYIVKPTQNSVNFHIYASAPSPYGASAYINIYGIR